MSSTRKTHPLVLGLAVVLASLGLLLAFLSLRYPDRVADYRRHFTETLPALDFRFDELSEHWTEADLRQQFPSARFSCGSVPPAMELGEWGCRTEISSHNGVRAMALSFFFREGRLDSASLQVPWWRHTKALRSILALYGRPAGFQARRSAGVRLVGWQLADGSALFFNRDRELNPLSWSTVFWMSRRSCQRIQCIHEAVIDDV